LTLKGNPEHKKPSRKGEMARDYKIFFGKTASRLQNLENLSKKLPETL